MLSFIATAPITQTAYALGQSIEKESRVRLSWNATFERVLEIRTTREMGVYLITTRNKGGVHLSHISEVAS